MADTDLTPVSEAISIPEPVETVDMSDWEDTTTPSATALAPPPPAPAPAPVRSASEPVQELGEDDFSSLNTDTDPVPVSSPPPVHEELLAHPQTLDIPATDISVLDSAEGPLPAEPMFAEEPMAPVSEEWASAPLAVDGATSAPPPTDEGWTDASEHRSFEPTSTEEALREADRMEVTASYALPAYAEPQPYPDPAADEAPTFDVSDLEAAPEPAPTDASLETPWETAPEVAPSAHVEPPPSAQLSAEPESTEQPTFDVADLGAEMEPAPAAVEDPADYRPTTLELNPVQVGPDLVADTVQVADSFDPEATQPSDWGTGEQTFDTGHPGDPVPLTSVSDYLGHNTQHAGGTVSDEPVPLEADIRSSWMSSELDHGTAEPLQLQSAADFMSTPEFISASATWGHRPESEQPVQETSAAGETYGYGAAYDGSGSSDSAGWGTPSDAAPATEAQPEWAAPVSESAPSRPSPNGPRSPRKPSPCWRPSPRRPSRSWRLSRRKPSRPWRLSPSGPLSPRKPSPCWRLSRRKPSRSWRLSPNGPLSPRKPSRCWKPSPRRPSRSWRLSPSGPLSPRKPSRCWRPSPRRPSRCWRPSPRRPSRSWRLSPNGPLSPRKPSP
ncbi:hypothetical protein ACN28S_45430 [Cystobacter fuscus]